MEGYTGAGDGGLQGRVMMKTLDFRVLLLLGALAASPARADDLAHCRQLSFAPLDLNLPACDRVIDAGGLSDADLAGALAARAEARLWAITYHLGHAIDPAELRALALADLDRAVALDPAHHGARAELRHVLGDFAGAIDDYSAAIARDPAVEAHYRIFRSYSLEAMGDLDGALADATRAIALSAHPSDLARRLARRAELRESAGDRGGALADHREVLRLQPGSRTAADAIERLSGPK